MNYVGQLYGRLGRKYFPLCHTDDVDKKDDIIKGLDRRTAEYANEIARLNGVVKLYQTEMLALQAKVEEQDRRIAGCFDQMK